MQDRAYRRITSLPKIIINTWSNESPTKTFKCLEFYMYIYDEGVRRSGEDWDTPLREELYYYNKSLAGLWQGI